MRKFLSAALACGALSLTVAGCDFANLMPKPNNSGTTPGTNVAATPDPVAQFQANLREAAAFASNLREAAAFGTITNGPVAALREAAALRISATDFWTSGPDRVFGTANLAAVGSATASTQTEVDFDVTVSTASALPDYVGTTIKGHLSFNTSSTPFRFRGEGLQVSNASGSKTIDFDFYPMTQAWAVTVPVSSGSATLYAHVDTTDSTGWVAKSRDGIGKIGNLKKVNGAWLASPLDNPDATQSVSMPF